MERIAAGIDLGTTYSCISVIDETMRPVVVQNKEGSKVTPSVVYFENDDNTIVGQTAKGYATLEPESVCEFVKRKMGRTATAITYHGKVYSPEQISSLILRKLVEDAEENLNKEIRDVVVTCPAYFGLAERNATKAAAEMAGLHVLEIINEPTAAALYYGCLRNADGKVVLVYDLGGGTFDVTIIRITPDKIIAIATGGDHELGGKNWDDVIIEYFKESFAEHKGIEIECDLEVESDLREKAERTKIMLSVTTEARNTFFINNIRDMVRLSRDDFESMTSDKIRRTIDITRETLEAAKAKGVDAVDEIIMVGGSCRMPMVGNALREAFPDIPILPFEPDEAVAKGAAIHADDLIHKRNTLQKWIDLFEGNKTSEKTSDTIDTEALESFIVKNGGASEEILGLIRGKKSLNVDELLSQCSRLVNITSKSFGIELVDENGKVFVQNLIRKQQEVPVSVTRMVGTEEDNALTADLIVYENDEDTDQFDVSFHKPLGQAVLELPPNLPARSRIELTFSLNTEGLLIVEGIEPNSGYRVKAEMHSSSILSREQIVEQTELIRSLKLI
ncbi:MAG: Hsp70 family protein [Lachnospiraceae bacterium]|nr:Hsp70 family protein [Lachnospiraceae bacterium]